jgi:hypothetical protein
MMMMKMMMVCVYVYICVYVCVCVCVCVCVSVRVCLQGEGLRAACVRTIKRAHAGLVQVAQNVDVINGDVVGHRRARQRRMQQIDLYIHHIVSVYEPVCLSLCVCVCVCVCVCMRAHVSMRRVHGCGWLCACVCRCVRGGARLPRCQKRPAA